MPRYFDKREEKDIKKYIHGIMDPNIGRKATTVHRKYGGGDVYLRIPPDRPKGGGKGISLGKL